MNEEIFTRILAPIFSLLLFVLVFNSAYGSGGGPCCIDLSLDKTIYKTGDTVKITAKGSNDYESFDGKVSLKIYDIMWGMDSPQVIYQEEKTMQNGKAEFSYKVTENKNNSYRFLASLESEVGIKSMIFFTKNNADKIILSDAQFSQTKIKPGEDLSISIKVNDGNGNYIPYVQPEAYIVSTSEGESFGSVYLYYDEMTKSYTGKLKIPSIIAEMKKYQVNVNVQIPYSDFNGFVIPDTITKEIEVLESGVIDACTKWKTEDCIPLKEIFVKDVKFEKQSAKPGELVHVEIVTTDENGKPVNVMSSVVLPYKACWGDSNTSSVGGYDKSTGSSHADLTIPDQISPGQYQLQIEIEPTQDTKLAGMTSVPFTVVRDESKVYSLFDQWSFPDGNPSGTFRFGETINYAGRAIYSDCSSPLANQNIKLEILQTFENGTQKTISQRETTSDDQGRFDFPIEMNDRNGCRYSFVLSTEYQGFADKIGGDFYMANNEKYTIHEEGKDFDVNVSGGCSIIEDFKFDKESKKMAITADTSDPMKVIQASFPHELLDGDFTVYVNGEQVDQAPISKNYETSALWFRAENQTKTTIEIIGTSAIPEFGFIATLILVISVIPIILASKLKMRF